MSKETITNIIYAILIVIAVLGEQLHFLPSGLASVILAAVTGHAVGGTSLSTTNNVNIPKVNDIDMTPKITLTSDQVKSFSDETKG